MDISYNTFILGITASVILVIIFSLLILIKRKKRMQKAAGLATTSAKPPTKTPEVPAEPELVLPEYNPFKK